MSQEATVRLAMAQTSEGGLRNRLSSPTPSLAFRPVGDDDIGLVGVIHTPDGGDLGPGANVNVRVVFPLDDADRFVQVGARFLLWNGRVVGTAEVLAVG